MLSSIKVDTSALVALIETKLHIKRDIVQVNNVVNSSKLIIFTEVMRIERLKLANYKNYNDVDLTFDPHVNIIHGPNGSGKTNLLDALHYLSVSKSYFSLSDKNLIKHDADFFRLEGHYEVGERKEHVTIKYGLGKRREIQINSSKLSKVQELIGKYPVVMIAPDDIKIVKGTSKDRRDYFNKWLCQSDPKYLESLMKYNRLLRQKDQLLKQPYS